MDELQTGLRHRLKRVARQISDQHRHLATLCAELRRALEGEAADGEVLTRFDGYRDAMDAHFDLELQVFFPALHGLRPDSSRELGALGVEHERLRAELAALRADLAGGLRGGCCSGLEAFVRKLGEHEAREERLVSSLADSAPGD